MIEIERFDWKSLRANGDASDIPGALARLLSATSAGEAATEYWKVDGTAVKNGSLYEAAVPTLQLALVGLANCTTLARPFVLDLIVQLSSGLDGFETELEVGILARSRRELVTSLSSFLSILEEGSIEEQLHVVDIMGLIAIEAPEYRARIRWYLLAVVHNGCDSALSEMISTTLLDMGSDA